MCGKSQDPRRKKNTSIYSPWYLLIRLLLNKWLWCQGLTRTGWWERSWNVCGETTATAKNRRNTKLLTAEYWTCGSAAGRENRLTLTEILQSMNLKQQGVIRHISDMCIKDGGPINRFQTQLINMLTCPSYTGLSIYQGSVCRPSVSVTWTHHTWGGGSWSWTGWWRKTLSGHIPAGSPATQARRWKGEQAATRFSAESQTLRDERTHLVDLHVVSFFQFNRVDLTAFAGFTDLRKVKKNKRTVGVRRYDSMRVCDADSASTGSGW